MLRELQGGGVGLGKDAERSSFWVKHGVYMG